MGDTRPTIPPIHSPTGMHGSSQNKAVSPSRGGPSVRDQYMTSTPHLSRHLQRSNDVLNSPHSPLAPTPRSLNASAINSPTIGGSLISPLDQHSTAAGPPLNETQYLIQLTASDGHIVRADIQARVDKGFFLADRDWTCYRRNYFSVVCSYSLSPATYAQPLYLRRSPNSPSEPIIGFAMCISAVVDQPGGKTVELVQHTPKRDKGPQHKPNKIKLSPQPAERMGFPSSGPGSVMQATSQPGGDDYSFPQNAPAQNIAVFDRIQFKSATANNGKRRAAQQYYHLIVELYAEVGTPQGQSPTDDNWVKIAYRVSAPMVVRGRSPGHYADDRRTNTTSSPGGGGSGNGHGNGHTQSPTSGPSGMMGGNVGSGGMMDGGATSMSMNGLALQTSMPMQSHHASPASASIHQSVSTPSTIGIDTPVDPLLAEEVVTLDENSLDNYRYFPTTIYDGQHGSPHMSHYDSPPYTGDRKSEHPLETSCPPYEENVVSYMPTSLATGEAIRKTIKEEMNNSPGGWMSAPVLGREHTKFDLFRKCGGRFEATETSRGYYPDMPAL